MFVSDCVLKWQRGDSRFLKNNKKKNRKDEERKGGSGADETFCGVTVVNTFCVPISIGSHQHQSFKTGASLGEPAVLTRSETRRIIFILIAPSPLSIPPPPPSRPRSLSLPDQLLHRQPGVTPVPSTYIQKHVRSSPLLSAPQGYSIQSLSNIQGFL